MMIEPFQQEEGYCGPSSISMCLSLVGIHADPRTVGSYSGRTHQYITEQGLEGDELIKASVALGVKVEYISTASPREFLRWLSGVTVISVDDDDHWIAVLSVEGESATIFDPNPGVFHKISKKLLGVRTQNSKGIFYGIKVIGGESSTPSIQEGWATNVTLMEKARYIGQFLYYKTILFLREIM